MGAFLIQFGRTAWAIIGPTVGTVVGAMVVALLRSVLAKQNLSLTEAQAKELERMVVEAINAVDEHAHRAKKEGETLTGPQKTELATNIILRQRPDLPAADVRRTIDGVLGQLRANNIR